MLLFFSEYKQQIDPVSCSDISSYRQVEMYKKKYSQNSRLIARRKRLNENTIQCNKGQSVLSCVLKH